MAKEVSWVLLLCGAVCICTLEVAGQPRVHSLHVPDMQKKPPIFQCAIICNTIHIPVFPVKREFTKHCNTIHIHKQVLYVHVHVHVLHCICNVHIHLSTGVHVHVHVHVALSYKEQLSTAVYVHLCCQIDTTQHMIDIE